MALQPVLNFGLLQIPSANLFFGSYPPVIQSQYLSSVSAYFIYQTIVLAVGLRPSIASIGLLLGVGDSYFSELSPIVSLRNYKFQISIILFDIGTWGAIYKM